MPTQNKLKNFIKEIDQELDKQSFKPGDNIVIDCGNLARRLYWSDNEICNAVYNHYIKLGIELRITYAGEYILEGKIKWR